MKNLVIVIVALAGYALAATMYFADEEAPGDSALTTPEQAAAKPAETAAQEQAAGDVDADLIGKLSAALGAGVADESIKPSVVDGWYEVARGSAIGYVSEDARYLIDGDLIDLRTKVNLTDKRRSQWRQDAIAGIDESKMIIFAPDKVKHEVTVFTDVDCGYCRKLHSEINDYMAQGISIRYVFYPLRGEKAASYKTAENVWCSDDRHDALTRAKQGQTIVAQACPNPVAEHLQTGRDLGIRGTPGLITEDGRLLPGYMPPKALLGELEQG